MTFELAGYRNFYNMVDWCCTNIGKKVSWVPIQSAFGDGWRIEIQPLVRVPIKWKISIDDDNLALMFALRFSESDTVPNFMKSLYEN